VTAQRVAAVVVAASTFAAIGATTVADGAATERGVPTKTIPTAPSTSSAAPSGLLATGIGLPAEASLPEFFPVVNDVIGATGDVAGELAVVAEVPDGIRSPDGSSIRQFSVDYDAVNERFVATVKFTSDATAEDTVVFFQATLTAAGFIPVADSGAPQDGETSRQLSFENPNSPLDDAGVDVTVIEGDTTDIELTITDSIDAEVLNAFTGWADGLPLLEEATPLGATITVSAAPGSGDLTLTISTQFAFSEYTPDELAAALRSALPDGGFSIDVGNDAGTGTTLSVRHIAMEDVAIEIGADETATTTLTVAGSVTI